MHQISFYKQIRALQESYDSGDITKQDYIDAVIKIRGLLYVSSLTPTKAKVVDDAILFNALNYVK